MNTVSNVTPLPSKFVGWFAFGLLFFILLAMYAPKIAGGVAILIALVLAMEATKKGII